LFDNIKYKALGRSEVVNEAKSLPLLLTGLDIEAAMEMEPEDIGLDYEYAELALEAMRAAVRDYLAKQRMQYNSNDQEEKSETVH